MSLKRNILIIVLDNRTTAMTGMQPNPMSGQRINGEATVELDMKRLADSVGIEKENFGIVDAHKTDKVEKTVKKLLASKKLSLLVVRGLCMILKKRLEKKGPGRKSNN